jgi:uncharacterized protein YecA (UPF0149 family)
MTMDVRTGKIRDISEVAAMPIGEQRFHIPMAVPPTEAQRRTGKVGRNHPCPCGSGRKFKHCHLLRGNA